MPFSILQQVSVLLGIVSFITTAEGIRLLLETSSQSNILQWAISYFLSFGVTVCYYFYCDKITVKVRAGSWRNLFSTLLAVIIAAMLAMIISLSSYIAYFSATQLPQEHANLPISMLRALMDGETRAEFALIMATIIPTVQLLVLIVWELERTSPNREVKEQNGTSFKGLSRTLSVQFSNIKKQGVKNIAIAAFLYVEIILVFIASLYSVAWYLDESVNREPLIVMLGCFAVLLEVIRSSIVKLGESQ